MKVEITQEGNAFCAHIEGRLDTASAPECEKAFKPLVDNADKNITLDCSKMEYISSSGLRLFLALRKEVQEKGGKLVVAHINDDIRNVFTITGFFKLFDIHH